MKPRWVLLVLLAPCGCGGFFEDNPEFVETEGPAETVGTASDSGLDTGSGEPVCELDEYELNDEASDAPFLPMPTNGQSLPVSAMLEGTGAVDWYAYDGRQEDNGPRYAKVIVDDGMDFRVCVYIKCGDGSEAVVDCGDEEPEESPFGYPGCCGLREATPEHECNGMPGGDAFVTVRISDATNSGACIPYSFEYRF